MRRIAVPGGGKHSQCGSGITDARESGAGIPVCPVRRHRLAHDRDGSVFNSLVNEQVAVDLNALNGDKKAVRPDLAAVSGHMVDIDIVNAFPCPHEQARSPQCFH